MQTAYRVQPLRPSDPAGLGPYELVGRLGAGGMGVVYLATAPDGGDVAIKLVHESLAGDPEFVARFRGEVEKAQQVPAFCTAEVLDADLDHYPPYLVVEYVDGPSLAEVVEERGPLTANNLQSLAVGVATALAGIHGAGVIHRDLKPENVLLAPGSPKVIDFGIARAFEATSHHTRTNQAIGTVAYMAPERFDSKPGVPLTAAADVFAWGVVVTFAGTGHTPFHGDSAPATAARILTQPPDLDGLPQPLRDLVALALAKEPAERPTARQLLDMLVGGAPVPEPPPAPPARPAAAPRPGPAARPVPSGPPLSGPPLSGPPLSGPPSGPPPVRPRGAGRRPARPAPQGSRLVAAFAVLLVLAGLAVAGYAVAQSALSAGAPSTDRGGQRTSAAPAGDRDGEGRDGAGQGGGGGRAEPKGGTVLLRDALDRPGRWKAGPVPGERGAVCEFDDALRATQNRERAEFQCPGPGGDLDGEYGVQVTTTLRTAQSCSALWFRYSDDDGGYVLRVCADDMSVATDMPGDRRVLGRLTLAEPIPVQEQTRVHLVVRDESVALYRDGGWVGAVQLPDDGPDSGSVELGLGLGAAGGPPLAATFADLEIRRLNG